MRNFAVAPLLACIITAGAARPLHAQDYPRPSKTPAASTAEEDAALRAGAQLHDQGKYDEAIATYREVLAKNAGNMTALYELAYTYLTKDDFDRALETARRGITYKSEQLPLFYDLIGSALDSKGDPRKAIQAYEKGVEYVPDAANLYYNMAVTYFESLKEPEPARRTLEKAAAIDPTNADVELMLGQLFDAGGYRTPAFLALSKFLVIRPSGNGTLQGYGVWRRVLRAGMEPVRGMVPADGAMRGRSQTPAAPPLKTDEGDFADLDRLVATTHLAAQDAMDKGKTEIEALVTQVDALMSAIARREAGAESTSFAWRHYAPYFRELKQKNYVEPFVYWISQRAPVPGVREWLDSHEAGVREFIEWTLEYQWPR